MYLSTCVLVYFNKKDRPRKTAFLYYLRIRVLFTFLPADRFGCLEDDFTLLFIDIHQNGGAILELAAQQLD